MSDFKTRALDIVNHFAKLVPEVEEDASRRSDYVYVDDPTGSRYLEVSFYDLSQQIPEIKEGAVVNINQLVEAALALEGIEDASEEFKKDIKSAIEDSFGIQYELANVYLKKALKEIEEINKEAGEVILSTWVLHSMLAGAKEFYESSRCW